MILCSLCETDKPNSEYEFLRDRVGDATRCRECKYQESVVVEEVIEEPQLAVFQPIKDEEGLPGKSRFQSMMDKLHGGELEVHSAAEVAHETMQVFGGLKEFAKLLWAEYNSLEEGHKDRIGILKMLAGFNKDVGDELMNFNKPGGMLDEDLRNEYIRIHDEIEAELDVSVG